MASSYMLQLHLGPVETVILSLFSFLLGTFMHKHINILHRWAIPVPAIGGLTVAIIVFLLQISGLILITLDKAVLVPAMVAFFATMGLVAPVQICTSSLKAIPRYWGMSTLLVVMQISIGLGLASLFGLDKHYAILLGSLSLESSYSFVSALGHDLGNALNGETVAHGIIAFTTIIGVFIGGPMGQYLIEKFNRYETAPPPPDSPAPTPVGIIVNLLLVLICVSIGIGGSHYLLDTFGLHIPTFIVSMLLAIAIRNGGDAMGQTFINSKAIALFSQISITIFLTTVFMSVPVIALRSLTGPMLVILLVQVIAIILFTRFIVFPVLCKDYDGVVIGAALLGHGLGITPNTVATIATLGGRYRKSVKAFLVVPITATVLINVLGIPILHWIMQFYW